jgi:hypothetical protein
MTGILADTSDLKGRHMSLETTEAMCENTTGALHTIDPQCRIETAHLSDRHPWNVKETREMVLPEHGLRRPVNLLHLTARSLKGRMCLLRLMSPSIQLVLH